MTGIGRRPASVAAAAALLLTLAACGGDDDTDGTAAESEPTEEVAGDSSADNETTEDETADDPEAAGDQAAGTESLRIGFLPPDLVIPAFQGMWHGVEGYGGERYGDVVEAVDAKGDPTVQLQTIQQWTELDQVDAIWVIPVAGDPIAEALVDATEAGIVVVAAGYPADYGYDGPMPGMTFSAIDNVDFGAGVGNLMAQCITERLDGEASVLYVGPSAPSETTENINTSSKEALAEGAPGATIVQELVAEVDAAGTQQAIESALQGNPDSNAFMAGDAEATMGGLNAYTAAGNDPAEICIVGNGGTEDQLAAVEAGELYGVVAFDFQADLAQTVDELHGLAVDPSVAGKELTVPINIIEG